MTRSRQSDLTRKPECSGSLLLPWFILAFVLIGLFSREEDMTLILI